MLWFCYVLLCLICFATVSYVVVMFCYGFAMHLLCFCYVLLCSAMLVLCFPMFCYVLLCFIMFCYVLGYVLLWMPRRQLSSLLRDAYMNACEFRSCNGHLWGLCCSCYLSRLKMLCFAMKPNKNKQHRQKSKHLVKLFHVICHSWLKFIFFHNLP